MEAVPSSFPLRTTELTAGYQLLRVKGTQATHVCAITPVVSVWCHWLADIQRTVPCLIGTCGPCKQFVPRRPLSYCGALHYRLAGDKFAWTRATLEVPFSTGLKLNDLRCQTLELRRIKRLGPVSVAIFKPRDLPPSCPPWDFLCGLCRMWRLPQGCQLCLVSPDQYSMVDVAHG